MDLAPVRVTAAGRAPPCWRRCWRGGVNAPVTTSMGRLFDGVAALIGLHQTCRFEGQAAMRLEFVADAAEASAPIAFALIVERESC